MPHATVKPSKLPMSGMNLADLQEVLEMYNEVTGRLEQSHERLQAEVARLTDQLEQKNRELELKKRLAALGEMAAGIAHEIRNPLGGIALYASTLAAEVADRPLALEIVGKIASGVKELNALVSDMLAFTQNIHVNKHPTAILDVVASAVELAAPAITQAGIQVRIDASLAAPEMAVAPIDAKLMRQVFLNLILNAAEAIADAAEAGKQAAPGRIDLRAAVAPGTLQLIVADNGPGIPPSALDKLFNPFFTTKHKGTGLGLAIVHRIIEAHGGTITAENLRGGGGAQISILLPSTGGVNRA